MGGDWHRFDYETRMGIIEDLFKKKKGAVKYSAVADWLKREKHKSCAEVKGGQGETGFESKLSSYMFFKDVLRVDEIDEADIPMVEELIWWNTLFEDRSILKESIEDKYGNRLSEDQIKSICKKRFTGWGRLSKKLLCDIKTHTDNGPYSIMDVLREGNPNNNARSETMVFMEIIRDDKFGFTQLIEEENKKRISSFDDFNVNDLPGSPAVRRTVNQAKRIVDETVGIAGAAPKNIFIEVARDEDGRNKGRRTKRRYDAIQEAVKVLKKEQKEYFDTDVANRLKNTTPTALDNERLALYFMQNGKCMYCGKDLDINQLDKYQVDHILPQSYVKDDSFENKALVHSEDNQRKSNSMLLDDSIIKKMKPFWEALRSAGLIGEKKFKNLTRVRVTDKELGGFIARQMVKTSQSMKLTALLLEQAYPDTHVRPVKAGFSSDLRRRLSLAKSRCLNDYHHAHDAYLACIIGQFISDRHSTLYENPIRYTRAVKKFISLQVKLAHERGEEVKTYGMPGSSSFIISSFLNSKCMDFDLETGEVLHDEWDAPLVAERIKKAINRKDCYISRMPEEASGAFWDATIYSPKQTKKKLSLPLKKGLDPQKYGSYSSEQFAYFALYEAKDKKDKTQVEFVGVPIPVAQAIKANTIQAQEYFIDDATAKGLTLTKVIKDRILRYTKVRYGGDEFYISALDAVYSSRQPAFSQVLTNIAEKLEEDKLDELENPDESFINLYDSLTEKTKMTCSRFATVQSVLQENRDVFIGLSLEDKITLLTFLMEFCHGSRSRVNLSLIKGSANSGGITNGFIKNDTKNLILIDQSVTGMFERKTYL